MRHFRLRSRVCTKIADVDSMMGKTIKARNLRFPWQKNRASEAELPQKFSFEKKASQNFDYAFVQKSISWSMK